MADRSSRGRCAAQCLVAEGAVRSESAQIAKALAPEMRGFRAKRAFEGATAEYSGASKAGLGTRVSVGLGE